jgi:hypothetical protein
MAPTRKKCVRSNKNRCVLSEKENETSSSCKLFNLTQRCRALGVSSSFVAYEGYKLKKTAHTFLQKKIGRVELPKLIELAKRDPDYQFNLVHILEGNLPDKKRALELEVLELASNNERDMYDSDIITLKSIKNVLKTNDGFGFLL